MLVHMTTTATAADFASVDFDPEADRWIAIHEHEVPGAVLLVCADERSDIPAGDPSRGGVVHLEMSWEQLAELHAAIADVLTRKP